MKPAAEITYAPNQVPSPHGVNWIIWSALLAQLGCYAVLSLALPGQADPPPTPGAVFPAALAAVGLSTGAGTLLIRRLALAAPVARGELDLTSREGLGRFRVVSIVNWVLSESIGIYGLVLAYLGGAPTVSFGFIAGAAVLMVIHAPLPSRLRRRPTPEELARGGVRIG